MLPVAKQPLASEQSRRKLTPGEEALFEKLPFWLRADQVRKLLFGCSDEHLRELRHKGLIECRDMRTPGAKRPTFRYYRDSVKAYLASLPTALDLLGV